MRKLLSFIIYRKPCQFLLIIVWILLVLSSSVWGQQVEIQGKAKIAVLDTVNSAPLLVMNQSDRPLATKQVSTLPDSYPDIAGILSLDVAFVKLLYECKNNMLPFLLQSKLNAVYTEGEPVLPMENLKSREFEQVVCLIPFERWFTT